MPKKTKQQEGKELEELSEKLADAEAQAEKIFRLFELGVISTYEKRDMYNEIRSRFFGLNPN